MIKQAVSLNETVAFLNHLARLDPHAMFELVSARTQCNDILAQHPTVQVVKMDGKHIFGLLGVFNGLFGVDENNHGPIAMSWEDGKPETLRFVRVDDEHQAWEAKLKAELDAWKKCPLHLVTGNAVFEAPIINHPFELDAKAPLDGYAPGRDSQEA